MAGNIESKLQVLFNHIINLKNLISITEELHFRAKFVREV